MDLVEPHAGVVAAHVSTLRPLVKADEFNSSDLTGRFPVTSRRETACLLVSMWRGHDLLRQLYEDLQNCMQFYPTPRHPSAESAS